MTTHTPKDARAYLGVQVGDQPLVPPEVQMHGTALEVALAAITRLAELKRPRSRVLHRRVHPKRLRGTEES
jgi:hypothetical protein